MNTPTTLNRRFFAASAGAMMAGLALHTAAGAASPKTGRGAGPGGNESRIRELYAAVNRKDLPVIAGFGAPSSEWLDVPFNFTSTGVNAIIDPWKNWFDIFPDATCEVRSLIAMGDHVVAQGIGRGTHKGVFNSPAGVLQPTGRTMQVSFCDVYQLQDGKIRRADSYFDFYDLVRQLAPEVLKAR